MKDKNGPLSNVEKFYIENHLEVDVTQLSKDLNKSIKIIKQYMEDLSDNEESKKKSDVTSTKVDGRTFYGRNKGSVVSTETASQRSEQVKAKYKKKIRSDIHRPYDK